jgi:protein ImuB
VYSPPSSGSACAGGEERSLHDIRGHAVPAHAAISGGPVSKGASPLAAIAQEFSPRYETHCPDLVSIDISGLERLLGSAETIGAELMRTASARGLCVHVALAGTQTAAMVLAMACPGLTVVAPGGEAAALRSLSIRFLSKALAAASGCPVLSSPDTTLPAASDVKPDVKPEVKNDVKNDAFDLALGAIERWGLDTLGELAALPPADLAARLGPRAATWQAMARGEDVRPLVPTAPEDPFEASLDLEWPIEGLEPLSFVLTRLLEPLSVRLERRDRGAAVLQIELQLVTPRPVESGCGWYVRRLVLPTPIRDVRTLRTLVLLDLEGHPPEHGIDRVTIRIEPSPGPVLQHTLFTRAHANPEQLSTLLARLGALMGQDRIGSPVTVDSYRPGAFDMRPFVIDHEQGTARRRTRRQGPGDSERRGLDVALAAGAGATVVSSAYRRCRQPVPARAVVEDGRPVRVTTDRRTFAGGHVLMAAGPWRTSGAWWEDMVIGHQSPVTGHGASVIGHQSPVTGQSRKSWNRDEWDVALADGALYRIFRDRDTDGWFIEAIAD